MKRIEALLPYYIWHLVIAVVITGALYPIAGSFLPGAVFYVGREVRDREKLGRWDWPGLLWPTIPLCFAEIYRLSA